MPQQEIKDRTRIELLEEEQSKMIPGMGRIASKVTADLLLLGWAVPLIAFSTPTTHHHTMLRQETSLFVNDLPCSPDSLLADHQSSNLVNTISDLAVPSITYATVAGDQSTLSISIGTGAIDWSSPFEAVFGGITLLYFAVSIWAGIKYIVKDGWRPKL